MTVSEREQLQTMDFEQMSAEQIANAKAEIRRLRLPLDLRRTRRLRPDSHGPRKSTWVPRCGAACGAAGRSPRCRVRAGSCARRRWSCFATSRDQWPATRRFCYISCMPSPTTATASACSCSARGCPTSRVSSSTAMPRSRFKWSPMPSPIGPAARESARHWRSSTDRWGKRVLAQGAVVLLVTDGLDRDGAAGLAENMDRLHRSCRRLIWLNPVVALGGVPTQISRHQGDAALRGRVPDRP